MLKYVLLTVLLTSLAHSEDANTTNLRVFWENFKRDVTVIFITGGKDLEKAVGYQGDLKINKFISFKANNEVNNIKENDLIENTTTTENYTDIYNEVYENEIIIDGKNSVTEKNSVEQVKNSTVVDDNKVTLIQAWSIFTEKLKQFLLHRDIELSIPTNYFTLDKYLRVSFKNMVANGGMVNLKLVNNKENVTVAEDKIDKNTREDIDFELPTKIRNLFKDVAGVFFSFMYLVPTFLFATFPSFLFFPFIFLRNLIAYYFFASSK